MSLRDLLETYALPLLAIGAAVLALGVWLRRRRRERERRAAYRPPEGPGTALALALDGDLSGAQRVLEATLRITGPSAADLVVGLVAVLKAQGQTDRARALLDRLALRDAPAWLSAIRVRLALDGGAPSEAAALADRPGVPIELALAALCRAGRWSDALRRYRSGVPRRDRSAGTEAALAAGCAVELASVGQDRSARRAVKRALALDPDGALPLMVATRLHPRAAERKRAAERVGRELPGITEPGSGPEAETIERAQAADADGEREKALGILRDAVEYAPRSWAVRRLYAEWLIESGAPEDWRAELAEIVDLLATPDQAHRPTRCVRCDLVRPEPFAVCPRCDAIGQIEPATSVESGPAAQLFASTVGCDLAPLLDQINVSPESSSAG